MSDGEYADQISRIAAMACPGRRHGVAETPNGSFGCWTGLPVIFTDALAVKIRAGGGHQPRVVPGDRHRLRRRQPNPSASLDRPGSSATVAASDVTCRGAVECECALFRQAVNTLPAASSASPDRSRPEQVAAIGRPVRHPQHRYRIQAFRRA